MRNRLATYLKTFDLAAEIACSWAEARFELVVIVVTLIALVGVIAVA